MSDLITSDSISDKFKALKEFDAGVIKITPKSKDGKALGAAIFVAQDEAQEILDAIQTIEDSWDE